MHKTWDENDHNRNYGFGCEFFILWLKLCLIRSVELFHFCVIACDGNVIFTSRIRIKLKSNDKPNELQQKKIALKNEIVMCFRLRIDRVRAYISGIQADRFFLTNEWKKNQTVSVWMAFTITLFYLSDFIAICCAFLRKMYCFLLLPVPNRMADVLPANLCNFSEQKAGDRFTVFSLLFFLIWTFVEHLTNQTLGCIICRLHFK